MYVIATQANFKGLFLKLKMLCIPNFLAKYMSKMYIICKRKWDTKFENIPKFVKGLPHMCPYHQPNPQRTLVAYTR